MYHNAFDEVISSMKEVVTQDEQMYTFMYHNTFDKVIINEGGSHAR